jgi:adenosylcobinamide kinase / adenosylcobinamide-phosphate guanylyltransferase
MEISLAGTGGGRGWPEPGCPCASCARAGTAGRPREPVQVLVDGVLRIEPGRPPGPAPGYRVERVPGGWAVTGPDGARLLAGDRGAGLGTPAGTGGTGGGGGTGPRGAADHGAANHGAGDQRPPYDIVLLDLLEDPAQLGWLRHQGLVRPSTVVAVLHADHRVSSEEELARRCGFWGVTVPRDGDVLTVTAGAGAGPSPAAADRPGAGTGQPRRVLVLGGARSGKSQHAELRLAAEPDVTYLAAGPYPDGAQPEGDQDWARRVAAHRARRPRWWQTVEVSDAAPVLRNGTGVILFDGAGTWLAAVMAESGAWDGAAGAADLIAARVDELVAAWRQTQARVVAVSDEVGSSIHPPTASGRLFRDQLGWLNQRLAAESEEAVLLVSGRALTLPA